MKVGIIGNTILTFKIAKLLLQRGCKIEYVFGLPENKLKNKVNTYDLEKFCASKDIQYINSNDWENIINKKVDIVYEMGDSRIVPASFLQKNIVIGNHGAVLPRVQGAASLTWGRMLNTGHWGVSLMRLNAQIDAGEILATKEITYNTDNTSMQEFVEMCDNATVDLVENHFEGNYKKIKNKKWDIKVAKGVDSEKVIGILRTCLQAGLNIYLPPRNPYDAKINLLWKTSFIEGFKKANNLPYPKYYIEK